MKTGMGFSVLAAAIVAGLSVSAVALAAGCCVCDCECGSGAKVSVFANAIERYAKSKGVSLDEAARAFYAAGIRGFDAVYGSELLDELAKGPLKPVNLFGWVDFSAPDNGAAEADAFIARALRFGVPRIMVIPNGFSQDGDQEAEFKVMASGLRKLAEKAKAAGVVATVEDYGGETNPCSYAKYLKRFLAEIPELGYALDAGNLHYAGRGDDILDMMRFAEGRIAHVHLKDFQAGSNRVRATIGLGTIPNETIVRTMSAKGYSGWITLEDLVGDPLNDVRRQVAVVRYWWSK